MTYPAGNSAFNARHRIYMPSPFWWQKSNCRGGFQPRGIAVCHRPMPRAGKMPDRGIQPLAGRGREKRRPGCFRPGHSCRSIGVPHRRGFVSFWGKLVSSTLIAASDSRSRATTLYSHGKSTPWGDESPLDLASRRKLFNN